MDDNKELYELWWEYLKRSKNFRIFCDVLVKYPDPETAFLRKMSILPFVPDFLPSSPERIMFNELLLWMNYKKFGDVFRTNFDDWWKSKQSDDSDKIVEDLEKIIEREACFFVGYCAKVFKVAGINDENIIELLHKYIRIQKDYKFIKIRISAKDKDIRNSVSRIISAVKKKHTPQLSMLRKYLTTFDLKSQDKSDVEIGGKIFHFERCGNNLTFYKKEPENREPMSDKEFTEAISEYDKYGKRLIRNAEQFDFPGDYKK